MESHFCAVSRAPDPQSPSAEAKVSDSRSLFASGPPRVRKSDFPRRNDVLFMNGSRSEGKAEPVNGRRSDCAAPLSQLKGYTLVCERTGKLCGL